jgi:hypothetical protein
VYSIRSWSPNECRAFSAFALTFFGAAVVFGVLTSLFYAAFHLEVRASYLIWFALTLTAAGPSLRNLTTSLFPNIVRKGDDDAATRLGGRVYLPTNKFWIRNFWWLDLSLASSKWSPEENFIRGRMFLIGFFISLPLLLLVGWVMTEFGFNERVALITSLLAALPPAFYGARKICISSWPVISQKAEDAAVNRDNQSIPPRS